MKSYSLTKQQIQEFVLNNKSKLEGGLVFGKKQKDILFETAKSYGFEIDNEKINSLFNSGGNQGNSDKEKKFAAILQITGNYSLPSLFLINTGSGNVRVELYIFHITYANKQNRILAQRLMEINGVKLWPGLDEEYLYEALSETTEDDYFETIKKTHAKLPIYSVVFKDNGGYDIEDIGKVI